MATKAKGRDDKPQKDNRHEQDLLEQNLQVLARMAEASRASGHPELFTDSLAKLLENVKVLLPVLAPAEPEAET